MNFKHIAIGTLSILFLSVFAVASMQSVDAEAAEDDSGKCGDNVTYVFDSATGTMTISGTGPMKNWSQTSVPWAGYTREIKILVIEEGVTSIGNYAFYGSTELTGKLILPESIKSIGNYAFHGCAKLNGELIIPDSVGTIGQNAFYGCAGLTSAVIGDSVTAIPSATFYGCTGLVSVVIGNSVTSVQSKSFYGCVELTSLVIGNSVKNIGPDAFYGCQKLSGELIIPDSVTNIENNAFYGCRELSSVKVGNSVKGIGITAFNGCTKLTLFDVSQDNANYSSDNGILYDKTKTQLKKYPAGKSESCLIPDSVTDIGTYAFYGCTGLTGKLIIPDSVKIIGDQAFYGCTEITSVVFGNSVATIGKEAFYGCTGLTGKLIIPDSVTEIKNGAFNWCMNITELTVPISLDTSKMWTNWAVGYLTKITFTAGTGTGFVYTQDDRDFTPWHLCIEYITEIAFADGIYSVADDMFAGFGFYGEDGKTKLHPDADSLGGSVFVGTYDRMVKNGASPEVVPDGSGNTVAVVGALATALIVIGAIAVIAGRKTA